MMLRTKQQNEMQLGHTEGIWAIKILYTGCFDRDREANWEMDIKETYPDLWKIVWFEPRVVLWIKSSSLQTEQFLMLLM